MAEPEPTHPLYSQKLKASAAPGVMKRMMDLAGELETLRNRLAQFQIKIDGGEPAPTPALDHTGGGLKSTVDRMEMDMRAITRTMSTLEELL